MNEHELDNMDTSNVKDIAYYIWLECEHIDDPNVMGYIGTKDNYERIPILKDKGNPIGGRIFFIDINQLDDDYTLDDLIDYLEKQVVLIE